MIQTDARFLVFVQELGLSSVIEHLATQIPGTGRLCKGTETLKLGMTHG